MPIWGLCRLGFRLLDLLQWCRCRLLRKSWLRINWFRRLQRCCPVYFWFLYLKFIDQTILQQRIFDGKVHGIRNLFFIGKTHFCFCRMHIDIHTFWIHFQKQHAGRKLPCHNQILVGAFQSNTAHSGAHISSIHKEVLKSAIGLGIQRLSGKPTDTNRAVIIGNRNHIMCKFFAADRINSRE